jgi:heterodisulfide reductase subunit C2
VKKLPDEKEKPAVEAKTVQPLAAEQFGKDFLKEVMKLPGGENILECIQCGTCAGGCPARFAMDFTPMQIIKMINLGMKKEVLSSSTIWTCSTCYTCAARCPRDVSFTTLAMSLKNKAIQENILEKPPSWKFHKYYYEIVNKYGRMHDLELMLKVMPKTDFGKVRRSTRLGLRMMRKGKVKVRAKKIQQAASLSQVLEKASGEEKK